ncbi:Meiotic recombination protein rec8 [Pseudocercospora fuligena]|uniref:Meiotic recombination protein rec8 n=1 Tax=Pseudocercospora fuligena TaxID=685502 RepID=A0A8H6RIB4_9PEZI|nr:Meiotic recombination protein rec8 [Pseudocercospora fuligena]
MFYSTEVVLTSRKYGVATVWLVATLGSKSTLKKVSRKAILDVDVVKACETIENPDAPMALRLQSNLLYGVTRVYAQQCGYVLSDAESARNNLRAMLRVVQQAELEKEGANKGRVEQLVLQDDPDFLPGLDLMPRDLDDLNLHIDFNDTQMSITPGSLQSHLHDGSQQSIGGLDLPPSHSSSLGGAVAGRDTFSIRGDSGPGTGLRSAPRLLDDDDLGLDLGVETMRQPPLPSGKLVSGSDLADGEWDNSAHDQPILDIVDDGLMNIDNDDENILGASFADGTAASCNGEDQDQGNTESASAMAAVRKMRKGRTKKTTAMDKHTTLHNSDISEWSRNYIANMLKDGQGKETARLNHIAKKNAEHWVLDAGVFFGQGLRGPLDMFSGAALIEAFTGMRPNYGKKRDLNDAEATSSSPKRARISGLCSDENGQGEIVQYDNDDVQMDHNIDQEIEVGREAPTPLGDRQNSSIFPWNSQSGIKESRGGGLPTSASFGGGPLNLLPSRRGSRLTSASPLLGRGINPDEVNFQLSDIQLSGEDEFELYGAAAVVDTQKAAESQWQRAALTGESSNFLEFVQSAIDREEEGMRVGIAFESLLPPANNTHIVAAQALLHVLSLGSKSVLKVEQREPFDEIWLET